MFTYTPTQLQVMKTIAAYAQRNPGMMPTLQEIGDQMGTHRVTIHQHVQALIKRGALMKLSHRSRALVILDPQFGGEGEKKGPSYGDLKRHFSHHVLIISDGKAPDLGNLSIECTEKDCRDRSVHVIWSEKKPA